MEENVLQPIPTFKLYKDKAIYLGTFIGGPLVAGYLIAENFKQLGQLEKVKITWVISILSTIVIFGGLFLIPNADKVPNYIIPIIYTGIAQLLVKKFQEESIKAHIAKGGQTFSNWRAAWIGGVGLVILLAIIFIIVLLANRELLEA
jgi:Na+/alanine symporter